MADVGQHVAAGSRALELVTSIRAQQALLETLNTALAEEGATVDQWRVLAALRIAQPEALTMGDLAGSTGIPRPTLSRIVDALEDAASVFRHADALDRRRITVHVSERGFERLARLDALVAAWESAALRSS